MALDSAGVLYAALEAGEVFYSTDKGLSFIPYSQGLPGTELFAIYYSYSNNALFLGTDKGVFKRSPVDLTSIQETHQELPDTYHLSNYPNPFNASTVLNFTLPENEFVRMNLFNSIGEMITEITNKEFESGKHTITFNAAKLSTGVYYCRMVAGKFNKTIKLVLIK